MAAAVLSLVAALVVCLRTRTRREGELREEVGRMERRQREMVRLEARRKLYEKVDSVDWSAGPPGSSEAGARNGGKTQEANYEPVDRLEYHYEQDAKV